MDTPDGERVLKHLHHSAVTFPRLGFEKGGVIGDVEEEFDLAGWGGG